MNPFDVSPPERLRRWPRRTRGRSFSLALAGSAVRALAGHWLEPLATVLNTCFHAPLLLAAIADGHRGPISNQGMVLAELDPTDELDPERVASWRARTGVPLDAPVMLAAPAWLHSYNYVPRADLVPLLATMVQIHRETQFPWLFATWPCALVPAPGEELLLRALEVRAACWDDAFLHECEALGLLDGRAFDAQRRALVAWDLPRLTAVLDATRARGEWAGHRERWDEVRWSIRSMCPPVSLRWFIAGVTPPEGVSPMRWLGASEAAWQRVKGRETTAGASGEWVVHVLGRRVALAWSVELGTPMLVGWRPAGDGERDTPQFLEVDEARETAAFHDSCRLFVRVDRMQDAPTRRDLDDLAWLARAWDELEFDAPTEPHRRARRSLLLTQAAGAALLDLGRHEASRALLVRAGHRGLVALHDAAGALLAYLGSAERRAIVGVGAFRQIAGAWVSPCWFMQDELRDHPDPRAFTARCERVLHGVELGPAFCGEQTATIDGLARTLQWRRDIGLVPALCAIR